MTNLTDTLCTTCGLCCDGSLLADVELKGRAEATKLEVMGLDIEDDGEGRWLMSLPCRALQGTRCGIYAHRPGCCRTFECRLLQDVRHGAVGVDEAKSHIAGALGRIARVKELILQLGQRDSGLPLRERCAEALAREAGATPEMIQKRAELDAEMSALDKVIRRTFLDEREPG